MGPLVVEEVEFEDMRGGFDDGLNEILTSLCVIGCCVGFS